MKVAILTRPDYKSPRILAETLSAQLSSIQIDSKVFFGIDTLTRLVSYKNSGLSLHFWFSEKIKFYFKDVKLIKELLEFDCIVICECTPNGFWKNLYNVERLKKIIKKPVLFYEVYYLENAPTIVEQLSKTNNPGIERYDWHFAVSKTTEIFTEPKAPWSAIGLYSKIWGISPTPKNELLAIVDFLQPGYEKYREQQIDALKRAGIPFISLERRYSIKEIREIYQSASIFFLQFPEAFGLPIVECLCAGVQIFTPDSGWPMAFRLNKDAEINGPGLLTECFTVYNQDSLYELLQEFKKNFHNENTPKVVFENFIANYPHYYYGDCKELRDAFASIKLNF